MLENGRQLVQPLAGPQPAQPGTGLRPRRSGRSDGPARMAQPRRSQGCTPPPRHNRLPRPVAPMLGWRPWTRPGAVGAAEPCPPCDARVCAAGSLLPAPHASAECPSRARRRDTCQGRAATFSPEGQRGNISGSAAHLGGNYSALLQREGRQRGHGLGPACRAPGTVLPGKQPRRVWFTQPSAGRAGERSLCSGRPRLCAGRGRVSGRSKGSRLSRAERSSHSATVGGGAGWRWRWGRGRRTQTTGLKATFRGSCGPRGGV